MTDYNDGNWHVWRGKKGDVCPVHEKSIGDVTYSNGEVRRNTQLSVYMFDIPLMFRVTNPYRETREVWVVGNHAFDSRDKAEKFLSELRRDYHETDFGSEWEPRLFREVQE